MRGSLCDHSWNVLTFFNVLLKFTRSDLCKCLIMEGNGCFYLMFLLSKEVKKNANRYINCVLPWENKIAFI